MIRQMETGILFQIFYFSLPNPFKYQHFRSSVVVLGIAQLTLIIFRMPDVCAESGQSAVNEKMA